MKSAAGFLKKLIRLLCAGAFTIFVAACYGVMMDYRFLFHVSDPVGSPLEGIKLTLLENGDEINVNYTDTAGEAYVYAGQYYSTAPDFSVYLTDVDGPDNGGDFQEVYMDVNGTLADWNNLTEYYVTMSPKE